MLLLEKTSRLVTGGSGPRGKAPVRRSLTQVKVPIAESCHTCGSPLTSRISFTKLNVTTVLQVHRILKS